MYVTCSKEFGSQLSNTPVQEICKHITDKSIKNSMQPLGVKIIFQNTKYSFKRVKYVIIIRLIYTIYTCSDFRHGCTTVQ